MNQVRSNKGFLPRVLILATSRLSSPVHCVGGGASDRRTCSSRWRLRPSSAVLYRSSARLGLCGTSVSSSSCSTVSIESSLFTIVSPSRSSPSVVLLLPKKLARPLQKLLRLLCLSLLGLAIFPPLTLWSAASLAGLERLRPRVIRSVGLSGPLPDWVEDLEIGEDSGNESLRCRIVVEASPVTLARLERYAMNADAVYGRRVWKL